MSLSCHGKSLRNFVKSVIKALEGNKVNIFAVTIAKYWCELEHEWVKLKSFVWAMWPTN